MRSVRYKLPLLILLLLVPALMSAQERYLESWELELSDEPVLIEKVTALTTALAEADMKALRAQLPSGKLRLLAGRANAPAKLCARSQAMALLADYLDSRPGLELEIDRARLEAASGLAHFTINYRYREFGRTRPHGDRIVAVYALGDGAAELVELRCP